MNMNTTAASATAVPVIAVTDISKDVQVFRPYNSQLPVPDLKGYRTVKVVYRDNGKGEKKGETSFIRVTDWIDESTVQDNIAALAPFFVSFLQGQEDEIVKEAHRSGSTTFTTERQNIAAIIEFLENNATQQRLNGEKIAEWFNDNMAGALADAFAEKLGISGEPTEAELVKLLQVCNVYSKKLQSLASPKTAYKKEEAELLQKALEVTGARETTIGGRFYARLEAMKLATPEDLLLSL